MSSETGQHVTTDPAPDALVIDRSIPAERWRYTCPEGHTDWHPTNSHIWCKGCRRAIEAGHDDLEAEYHCIVDQQTGEAIHWSGVRLKGSDEVVT